MRGKPKVELTSDLYDLVEIVTQIWNRACGEGLEISPEFVQYNLRGSQGAIKDLRIAAYNWIPVGFVIASTLPNNPLVSPFELGWIDAIAVEPSYQSNRIGSILMDWAENWLRQQGCRRVRLGGSLRTFMPGLPVELNSESFFIRLGYGGGPDDRYVWDVSCDLGELQVAQRSVDLGSFRVNTVENGELSKELEKFLWREFPGRWRFEFEEFQREGGRLSDYLVLYGGNRVEGFCTLRFEDSIQPLNRFYMSGLPRPWGQLGPIGVGKNLRGHGFGSALLQAGLERLRSSGVRGCVIDWTDLVEFYARYGFKPYRQYHIIVKDMS